MKNLIEQIRRRIFGYDIFISYSRNDGLNYSYSVARHFLNKGFECYIDQLSTTSPGTKLPKNIQHAVKRSSAFVLIGSASAGKSEPISKEIQLFLESNNNKPMLPISIGGSINDQAIWYKDINGLALIDEAETRLNSGIPSDETLERIENALEFTKKSDRLRRTFFLTILAIIVLVGTSAFYANHFLAIAESRSLAIQAGRNIETNFDESLRLAAESFSTKDTPESRGALLEVLNYNPTLEYYMYSKDEFQTNGVIPPSNDSILITHGFNDELRIWDLEKRERVNTIPLSSKISTFNTNRSGDILAVGHLNGDITLFTSLSTDFEHTLIPKLGIGRISSLAFISNDIFAFSSEEGVFSYDVTSDKKKALSTRLEDKTSVLTYLRKDSTIIVKGAHDKISFFDVSDQMNPQIAQFPAHPDVAYSLTVHPEEGYAAIGYHDGTVSVWDLQQKVNIGNFPTEGRVLSMYFLSNNELLTSSDEGLIVLRNFNSDNNKVFRSNNSTVDKIIVDKDEQKMISLSRDGKIAVHDLSTQNPLIQNKTSVELRDFSKITIGPNSKLFFIASDFELFSYDPESRTMTAEVTFENEIKGIGMNAEEQALFTFHENNKVLSWDLTEHKLILIDSLTLESSIVAIESFGKKGVLLFTSDGDLILYNSREKTVEKLVPPKELKEERVISVRKQSQGNLIAISLDNFSVILYDLEKSETKETLEFDYEIRNLEFSESGEEIFIADWNKIKIWSIQKREYRDQMLVTNELPISQMTLDENLGYVAASDNNKSVTFWDLNSLTQIGPSIGGVTLNTMHIDILEERSAFFLFDARYEQGFYYTDVYELSLDFELLNNKVKSILNQVN